MLHAKKKKKEEDKPTGAPAWMVTYGDMMTLILTFFVLLLSFSIIEEEKFRAAMGAFKGALQPWTPSVGGRAMIRKERLRPGEEDYLEVVEQLEQVIEEAMLDAAVDVYQSTGGVRLVFADPVLFDEGKAELKTGAHGILVKVAELAKNLKGEEILVEGHTDDTPIRTSQFPTNWELSAARALKVLRFFQAQGVPPEKLAAVGYGEFRPRQKLPRTATRAEKSVNRRVEIFLRMRKHTIGNVFSPASSSTSGGWED